MVCLTHLLPSPSRAGRQHREVMRCSLWAYQSSQIVVFKDKPSGALIFPPAKPKAAEFSSSERNPLLHDTVSLTFSLLYVLADDKKCKACCKGQQWQALPRDQRIPQRYRLHGREAGGGQQWEHRHSTALASPGRGPTSGLPRGYHGWSTKHRPSACVTP